METTLICAFHVCNATSVPPSISHGFCSTGLVKEWSVCPERQLIAGLYARGYTQHRPIRPELETRVGETEENFQRLWVRGPSPLGRNGEKGKQSAGGAGWRESGWYSEVAAWVCQSAEQRSQAGVSWLIWVAECIICWNLLWTLKNGGIEIKIWISDILLKIRKLTGWWRCMPWEEEVGRSWGQRGL